MKKILITGATGKIGSLLVPRLAKRIGLQCRVFVRDEAKAKRMFDENVRVFAGDFTDLGKIGDALSGVDTVVLITAANELAVEQAGAILRVAVNAGVRKIIRVSVFKAAVDGPTDITRMHGQTDLEIVNSGLAYTILRPGFFMQNFLFLAAQAIALDRRFYFGAAEGKLGMIDYRDIVDCIEQVIVSGKYDNEIFTLTGPESISFGEVAGRLSVILGQAIEYIPVLPEAVAQTLVNKGLDEWYAGVMGQLCTAYSRNWGDVSTDHVLRLSGHEARSFDQFAREVLVPAITKMRESISIKPVT